MELEEVEEVFVEREATPPQVLRLPSCLSGGTPTGLTAFPAAALSRAPFWCSKYCFDLRCDQAVGAYICWARSGMAAVVGMQRCGCWHNQPPLFAACS